MSLRKEGYLPRIIDAKIAEYLRIFGALSIEGPKWCGKTWTALNHANSVTYIMDPSGDYGNRERAHINPALVLAGERPHLIDECQEVPGIWDAVRFAVDMERGGGQYILTGSVSPPRESYSHSGAGRFAIIRMRPMSLFESGESSGLVSLAALLGGERIEAFSADMDIMRLIEISLRGGWPEALLMPGADAAYMTAEYLELITKNEMFRTDDRRRSMAKLGRLLRSLARNNATTVSISTLSLDAEQEQTYPEGDISISRQSTAQYLDDLKRIFVIEEIPGFIPQIRSKTRMRMAPKIIFTDPSLALAALGLTAERALHDLKTYGFMFENLCLRDMLVYAEHIGARVFHYRDDSGLEADAIVEMTDGTWGAFEIKLGEHQVDVAASTLCRLREKMRLAGYLPPACLCVLTGGGFGRLRDDGVYVIPINALGP